MLPLGEYKFKDDAEFEKYMRLYWESESHGSRGQPPRDDDEFEKYMRLYWESESHGGRGQPPRDDDEAEAVLSTHAATCSRLVMDNGFVQPFQLQADPKQQDQWTTFVEYLAFECFWLVSHTRCVRYLQPQHDTEWEKLVNMQRYLFIPVLSICVNLASIE
ncbi:hypothetical protein N0V85_007318, partial [Neurospora sp. IMI 360204]